MPPKANEATVEVVSVDQVTVDICILGKSPIIANRLSEKAKRELLMPSGRKTQAERSSSLKHDPVAEFRSSPYVLPDGEPALLALTTSMFKGAMGVAALDLPGATKSKVGRLVSLEGDYVPLFGLPKLFMSVVRSADMNRTPDIRSRVIVPEWCCRIAVSFVSPMIRQPAVVNLLAAAGITAGVGDWRPEKGKGGYGRFEIVQADDPRFTAIERAYGREVQRMAMDSPECYDAESKDLLDWYLEETHKKGFKPTQPGVNGFHVEDAAGLLVS